MNYKDLNDYELLSMASDNEVARDTLYEKYRPLIYKMAKKLHKKNKNVELSDLIQEGNIGFTLALKYYDESKNILFFTYASLCIEKTMISYIIGSKRQKHKILNESISMEQISENDKLNSLDKIVKDSSLDPSNIVLSNENKNQIFQKLKAKLTDLELAVLDLRCYGFDYKEIASILGKDVKAIDNAVQRIRYKAKKIK